MSNLNLALECLRDSFEKSSWPLDLNWDKVQRRARLVSDNDDQDIVVVEIERHRSSMGDTYIKGCRMNAYETYFMRYQVNLKTRSVSELAERRGEIAVDPVGLAEQHLGDGAIELKVTAIDLNRFMVRDQVSHDEAEVTSLEEVIQFALDQGELTYDYFVEDLDRTVADAGSMTEEKRRELLQAYKDSLNGKLTQLAKSAWKHRIGFEDD